MGKTYKDKKSRYDFKALNRKKKEKRTKIIEDKDKVVDWKTQST